MAITFTPSSATPALSAARTTFTPSAVRPLGNTGSVYQISTPARDCCRSLRAWLWSVIDFVSATAAPSMSKSMRLSAYVSMSDA